MSESRKNLSRRALIGGAAAGSVGLAAAMLEDSWPHEASAASQQTHEGSATSQQQVTRAVFALELQDGTTGFFSGVQGLGSETEIIEQKVVDASGRELISKLPGRLKWGDIVLKRGITADSKLWEWRKMVEEGDVSAARKDGSIVLYDQAGTPVARWNFENAWPSKVSGPYYSPETPIAVEEIVLVHEGMRRA